MAIQSGPRSRVAQEEEEEEEESALIERMERQFFERTALSDGLDRIAQRKRFLTLN